MKFINIPLSEMDKKMVSQCNNPPRNSAYGFFCTDCKAFTYAGFDTRHKIGLMDGHLVCADCGDNYRDR